jgi:hypothetical protein
VDPLTEDLAALVKQVRTFALLHQWENGEVKKRWSRSTLYLTQDRPWWQRVHVFIHAIRASHGVEDSTIDDDALGARLKRRLQECGNDGGLDAITSGEETEDHQE